MRDYLKPYIEDEDIEIEDVIAVSGVMKSPAGNDFTDDTVGGDGEIL